VRQRTTPLTPLPFGRPAGARSLLRWLAFCCLSAIACDDAEPQVALEPPSLEQRSQGGPEPTAEDSPVTVAEETPRPLPSMAPDDGALVLPVPGSDGRAPVNQILFKLNGDGANRAEADRVARSVDGELVSYVESVGLYMIRVPTETMEELAERMARVASDAAVETAMHNWVAELD